MSQPRTPTKSEQQAQRAAALTTGLNRAARRRLGLKQSKGASTPVAPSTNPERRARDEGHWSSDDITLRRGEFATPAKPLWKPRP
jgi:hypothetical protein